MKLYIVVAVGDSDTDIHIGRTRDRRKARRWMRKATRAGLTAAWRTVQS